MRTVVELFFAGTFVVFGVVNVCLAVRDRVWLDRPICALIAAAWFASAALVASGALR